MANKRSTLGKEELRIKIRRSLAKTDKKDRRNWSALLCRKLSSWISSNGGIKLIATYASLETEVDLAVLHTSLPARYRFAYPLISGSMLSFHLVEHQSELRHGAFNIPEPDPDIHPSISPEEIDLCLCPGLAFTHGGARLGRGKAYYDAALQRLNRKSIRMGVAFDLQVYDDLPVEAHDISMTHLATPSGIRPTPEY